METSTQYPAICDLTPMLQSIVQEFEGRVKQLWTFSEHNPQADFAQLEEQARLLSTQCFGISFANSRPTARAWHRRRLATGPKVL